MMLGLQAKLIGAIIVAVLLAGLYWRGYTAGSKAVRLEWDADISQRTAAALEAEKVARAREQELQKQVETVRGKYAQQAANVRTVASAAGHGMRELQAAIAASDAAGPKSCPAAGANADARSQILRECTAALQEVAADADGLAARLVSLQEYVRSIR